MVSFVVFITTFLRSYFLFTFKSLYYNLFIYKCCEYMDFYKIFFISFYVVLLQEITN